MSVPDSRSTHYSADATGHAGRAVCHVVRTYGTDDGRAQYSIVVHNDTSHDLQAFAFVPDKLDLRDRTIVQSIVGPYSDFSTNVEIDATRYEAVADVHLEISGEDLRFDLIVPHVALAPAATGARRVAVAALAAGRSSSVATSVPVVRGAALARTGERVEPRYKPVGQQSPAVREQALASPAFVPMFALFAALMAAAGVAAMLPHVWALGVPPVAQAKVPVPVSYRATGIGSVRYTLIAPDASTLTSGALPAGSGRFALQLPPAPDERSYLVRLEVAGPLGRAMDESFIKVPGIVAAPAPAPVRPARRAAAPVPLPPQIRSFALDRATLAGGETLNVYYDVAATSGTVALIDGGTQIAYGSVALSPSGHTAMVVPAGEVQRSLSIVLTARRGAQTAQSRIALSVAPSSPAPLVSSDPDTTGADLAPVISAPKTVVSGGTIRVLISGSVERLTLLLTDDNGTVLARREIGHGQTAIALSAPSVRVPTRIRLEGSYERGAGSETVVQTIDVTPR